MKTSKKVILIAILILTVAGIAILTFEMLHKSPVSYNFYRVKPVTIRKYVLTTGTINPINSLSGATSSPGVAVGAQVSGMIDKLFVWYNSKVKKGQLLAEIDPTSFIAKVEMDKANLKSAAANILKQKSLLAFDKLTYFRDKKLWEENLIAHQTEQSAKATYRQDIAYLKYLKSQLSSIKQQLSIDETNLSYTKIYSPVNGIIVNVNISVGQTVASAFQAPTLFTIGESLNKMAIYTTTNEADLSGIKKGDKVSFTVYAYPNKVFYGYVHDIRINPTIVSGVVSYTVTVYFNNKNNLLLPGMTATPKIYTEKKEGVIAVPNSALRFMPPNISSAITNQITKKLKPGQGVVWVFKNNQPVPLIVKLGINNNTYTQVISKQITAGSIVITGLKTVYVVKSSGFKGGGRLFF